jgi:hypothetical protein
MKNNNNLPWEIKRRVDQAKQMWEHHQRKKRDAMTKLYQRANALGITLHEMQKRGI